MADAPTTPPADAVTVVPLIGSGSGAAAEAAASAGAEGASGTPLIMCDVCLRATPTATSLICSKCMTQVYCSSACQEAAAPLHKKRCAIMAAGVPKKAALPKAAVWDEKRTPAALTEELARGKRAQRDLDADVYNASLLGRVDLLDVLFTSSSASPSAHYDAEGFNAIHRACQLGNVAVLKRLIEGAKDKGLAVNAAIKAESRETGATIAIYSRHLDCLNVLLDTGCVDLLHKRQKEFCAIHLAASVGSVEAVTAIVAAAGKAARAAATEAARAPKGGKGKGKGAAAAPAPVTLDAAAEAAIEAKGVAAEAAMVSLPTAVTGQTPLHVACESDRRGIGAVIRFLVSRGADVNAADKFGVRPLDMAACRGGAPHCFALLLSLGASPAPAKLRSAKAGGAWVTYLHQLAASNSYDVLKLALGAKGTDGTPALDAGMRDCRGDTALHLAALAGAETCVDLLLQAGARPDGNDHPLVAHDEDRVTWPVTPLTYAVQRGNVGVVRQLLAAGADPTKGFDDVGNNLFMLAMAQRACKAAGRLRDGGENAFHFASSPAAWIEIGDMLVDPVGAGIKGATALDVKNCRDRYGMTPLHAAAAFLDEDDEAQQALFAKVLAGVTAGGGAGSSNGLDTQGTRDVHEGPSRFIGVLFSAGATPLHCAALTGRVGHVAALLDAGATLMCTDGEGDTPLHQAAFASVSNLGDAISTMKLLIARGIPRDVKNKRGTTPLQELTGFCKRVQRSFEALPDWPVRQAKAAAAVALLEGEEVEA